MVCGRSATAFEGTRRASVRRKERATGLYTEVLRRIQSHNKAVILAEKVRGPSPSSTIVTNGVARAIAERNWRPTNGGAAAPASVRAGVPRRRARRNAALGQLAACR